MPELPEVETIRIGLEKYLPGKEVADVEIRADKIFSGNKQELIGKKVLRVRRRAKVLLLDFSNELSVLVHLKMTGQLVFQSADEKEKIVGGHPQAVYNQPLPHLHTHVIFTFQDGSKLFFNDLRRFGWMHVVPTREADSYGMLKMIGPEPLEKDFTVEVLKNRLLRYPNRLIYQSLMDQSVIAGIGNIYANEALYETNMHPERRVKDIKEEEWPKLWQAIRHVLQQSIKYGGTSDSTYVSAEGKRGDYLSHAHVYRKRIAKPCGHDVARKTIGGRMAHFCAIDQQ